jgi:hypothetical protein
LWHSPAQRASPSQPFQFVEPVEEGFDFQAGYILDCGKSFRHRILTKHLPGETMATRIVTVGRVGAAKGEVPEAVDALLRPGWMFASR